jgi:type I restriction enzyme S subunit
MNPERLLQHFERISEAPDAIPRLRRFILDLAVRGKLVEQDLHDEPASELLRRIQAAKARLVKEGRIRAPKPPEDGEPLGEPYEIPKSWKWVRLGETINAHLGGGTPSKSNAAYWDGGIYWASVKDVGKSKFLDETIDKISEAGLANSSSNLIPPGNLIVVTRMGLGKVSINRVPVAINQDLRALFLSSFSAIDYYYIFFKTHGFEGTGLTVKGVKVEELLYIAFPLPPLAEQHRIVAKVDKLMALCDQLEAANTERERSRDRLVVASLHRLNSPDDTAETNAPDLPARQADAFRDHARFVFNHLPRLTARPEHIKQLRQTILNLAVRGQLVPQDPNDEPAEELLKRIQAEKVRLVKEGKISREKPLIPAGDDDLAFGLKPGWQATRIGEILVELQTGPFGSSLHQSDYQKGGIPVINPASIKNERLVPIDGMAVGPVTLERLATFKLRAGDIVMGRRGEMGRCAVVTEHEAGWLCGTGSLRIRLPECVFPRFFVTLIGSPFVREYLGGSAVGATMQNLNQSILLNLVIGLPPLAEQHRIVARVDELMALCDQLEAQLTTTEADSRRLLAAVLHEALNPLAEVTEQWGRLQAESMPRKIDSLHAESVQ